MRFARVYELVCFRPWLITPEGYATVRQLVERKIAGELLDAISDFINPRPKASVDADGIGHVHVTGIIGQGLSKLERACANTDTADVMDEVNGVAAEGAQGILLHIDSPGGTVTGVPELADDLSALANQVPMVAHTNSLMASAAMWIGSAADAVFSTKSADVGSVGVYIPWVDYSARFEERGLKPDPIVNDGADLKALGFTGSLSEAQREELQASVNETATQFQEFVAANRPPLDTEAVYRGGTFSGTRAHEVGLTDGIASASEARDYLLEMI